MIRFFGAPLLDLALFRFRSAGISDIAVNAHYLAQEIESGLKASPWGKDVKLSIEDPVILGRGGAYIPLRNWFGKKTIIAYNGDIISDIDVAAALAQAGATALGPFAPYAIAPIGLLAGLVTGSGVGANAALMPVQVALGAQAGLPPLLAPAVQVFASSAGAGMSVGVTAMLCGLLGDGTRPAQLWRLLAPSILAVLLLAWLTLAFAPLP
jgi:hypothetical protein